MAEYGMYGHGCMGVGCIPTYMDVRAWAVFKGSGMYLYRYLTYLNSNFLFGRYRDCIYLELGR